VVANKKGDDKKMETQEDRVQALKDKVANLECLWEEGGITASGCLKLIQDISLSLIEVEREFSPALFPLVEEEEAGSQEEEEEAGSQGAEECNPRKKTNSGYGPAFDFELELREEEIQAKKVALALASNREGEAMALRSRWMVAMTLLSLVLSALGVPLPFMSLLYILVYVLVVRGVVKSAELEHDRCAAELHEKVSSTCAFIEKAEAERKMGEKGWRKRRYE